MNPKSVRKTVFFGGSAFIPALFLSGIAFAAMAEDVVATKAQRFTGRVLSATTNGVLIQMASGQQFQVPRGLIVEIKVEQPSLIEQGITYYESGRMREAAASLGKAIPKFEALDTEWAAKAVLYYARASLAMKDYAAAARMFNAFIAWYPDSPFLPEAEVGLVEIDMHQGKNESALEKFIEMAVVYDGQVKPDAAGFRQAAIVYLGIGQCYENLGQKEKALNAYLTVIALYPEKGYVDDALFKAGRICVALGRLDKANDLFAELLDDHKDSEFARDAISEQAAIRQKKTEAGASGAKPATR